MPPLRKLCLIIILGNTIKMTNIIPHQFPANHHSTFKGEPGSRGHLASTYVASEQLQVIFHHLQHAITSVRFPFPAVKRFLPLLGTFLLSPELKELYNNNMCLP